jgi:hypothetical protein
LRDFERVHVLKGETASVTFSVNVHDVCKLTNEKGDSVVYGGTHYLDVSRGYPKNDYTYTVNVNNI